MSKRVFLFAGCTLILAVSFLYAAGNMILPDPKLDEKIGDDFRGIAWGADLSGLSGMQKDSHSPEGYDLYRRDGDTLNYEGANASKILYGFAMGKFTIGCVFTQGKEDYLALKKAAEAKLGPGFAFQKSSSAEQYAWQGSIVYVTLRYNESSHRGELRVFKDTNVQVIKEIKLEMPL